MKKTVLEISDEVNVRFHNLDVVTRRKLTERVKFFLPHARYTPAFKLKRWDGTVSFCDIGARTYLNLLDVLLPIVESEGYDVEIDDKRQAHDFVFEEVDANTYKKYKWPKGHICAKQPIILRDYQVEIINTFLKNLQSVQCISTGAGKTLVTAALSERIQKYGRTIVIVPSKDLVTQTETDYKNLGLDVGVYYGDRKEYNKTHTICTWQSLEILNKKTKKDEADFPLDEFIKDVVCVMVDEVHKAKADVLKKLLTGAFADIPIRWGLTGTVPEDDWNKISIICSIGPVISELRAKDLQDKGVLSQLHINIIQTIDPEDFGGYQTELKWLVTSKERVDYLAKHIRNQSLQGNTLVLIDRIETGEMLLRRLPEAVFISGEVDSADRKKEYKDVQTSTNKIIIATYGVASTGIDLPRIFNLYLIEPGKSFVRVIQSIGRGIRKALDKDFVNIFDVCSTAKYSKKHLLKRKKFYKDAEYQFTITKEDYL